MMNFNGFKTYILAGLGVVYAVSGYFTGNLDGKTALEIVWASLAAASLRHAVAKVI